MHCCRPSSTSVQQLLVRAFREVVDCTLGDAILEMSVDPAEGKSLLCGLAGLFESIVLEPAVVAVIVCNFHAVVSSELFEGALGFDCFVGRRILH